MTFMTGVFGGRVDWLRSISVCLNAVESPVLSSILTCTHYFRSTTVIQYVTRFMTFVVDVPMTAALLSLRSFIT